GSGRQGRIGLNGHTVPPSTAPGLRPGLLTRDRKSAANATRNGGGQLTSWVQVRQVRIPGARCIAERNPDLKRGHAPGGCHSERARPRNVSRPAAATGRRDRHRGGCAPAPRRAGEAPDRTPRHTVTLAPTNEVL